MNIKDLSKKSLDFTIKRVAEIIGILLICLSTLFLLSLISYSPEDPNFIFSENTIINNILGFKGSYVSDLFFQSVGLISFLIAFTIFFTGINLIKYKNFLVIIENIFYSILYIILGSLFFSIFYPNSFSLSINGNGGFVGIFVKNTFLSNLVYLNQDISYYIILFLIILIFLFSINFSLKFFISFFKNIYLKISKKNNEEIQNINTFTEENQKTTDDIQKPTQEDLPFNTKNKKINIYLNYHH